MYRNKLELGYLFHSPVFSHYTELRYRFFYSIFSLICAFITSYYYQLELMYIIARPFLKLHQTLQSTDITEALSTTFKLCVYFSLGISFLICIYHYWSFLLPSRYVFERKRINFLLFFLGSLLILESYGIYFYFYPKICQVFSSFQIYLNSEETLKIIEMSPKIESTLSSSIRIYFILCLLFQIPIFFLFLFYFEYCNCFTICRYRKSIYFILICFSALISPPDLVSQILCFFFTGFLFEFSLWIGCLFFIKQNYTS
jgi:sec-independent protein translocase protein TatC